jgi:predicted O-methyltransferase YrrM
VPWLPVSFVARFESWPTSEWSVFEWGSGWSTLWLASRCARVVSVESDPRWHRRIGDAAEHRGLDNLTLLLRTDPAEYVAAIEQAGMFDCVVVDGDRRNACAALAVARVRKVLVFDNASRGEYEPARAMLHALGWPIRVEQWTPGQPRHDQADTWYYARPEFREGYVGLPPSPHEAW